MEQEQITYENSVNSYSPDDLKQLCSQLEKKVSKEDYKNIRCKEIIKLCTNKHSKKG